MYCSLEIVDLHVCTYKDIIMRSRIVIYSNEVISVVCPGKYIQLTRGVDVFSTMECRILHNYLQID